VSELQTLIQDELPNKRVEQCVEDLQAEIFDFCMRTEVVLPLTEIKNLCKSNYFQCLQKDINEKMRAILIDWLVDVHSKFKMNHQTLFLAVNLIDRYLEQIVVPRTQLQLVGISSLFIASKYEEIYPPDLKDFVKCCDNTYTAEQILEVESQIISILNFNLVFTSAYQFFELFSQKRKHGLTSDLRRPGIQYGNVPALPVDPRVPHGQVPALDRRHGSYLLGQQVPQTRDVAP
jgi:hypothetical protein